MPQYVRMTFSAQNGKCVQKCSLDNFPKFSFNFHRKKIGRSKRFFVFATQSSDSSGQQLARARWHALATPMRKNKRTLRSLRRLFRKKIRIGIVQFLKVTFLYAKEFEPKMPNALNGIAKHARYQKHNCKPKSTRDKMLPGA